MKKTECFTDEEVKKLAEEIVEKYQELFSGIDLSKIHFIRIKNKKNRNIIELKNISFPYNLDINYAFYFLTYNKKWMMLNEEQKKIAVMNGLYGIQTGGTDINSSTYGCKRRKDIQEYSMVLNAVGGRYDWKQFGAINLPDILSDEK